MIGPGSSVTSGVAVGAAFFFSAEQLQIITAIDKGSSHIDDIIEETGLGTAKVLAQLTVLEIKGFIRRQAGRRVTLNTAKK